MQTKLKASVENQRYHMVLIKLSMQIKFNALLVHLYNPSKKTQYILTGKSLNAISSHTADMLGSHCYRSWVYRLRFCHSIVTERTVTCRLFLLTERAEIYHQRDCQPQLQLSQRILRDSHACYFNLCTSCLNITW